MKKVLVALIVVPGLACAQVHGDMLTVDDLVTPTEQGTLAALRIVSHESVRIEECTLSFSHDNFLQEIERLYLFVDDDTLSTLSFSNEALFSPLVHFPSCYVGMLDDTVREMRYVVDITGLYEGVIETQITCRINFYMNENHPDTTVGPFVFSQDVAVSVSSYSEERPPVTVLGIQGGLSIGMESSRGLVMLYDMTGKSMARVSESCILLLGAGIYVAIYQEQGQWSYLGRYIVP
jgi:hypothetical protein